MNNFRIGFVGLGKLGMPCAEAMATVYKVTGYDVLDKTSDKINIVSSIEQAVRGRDIIFVAVPTPHDPRYDGSKPTCHLPPKDFDYTQVKQALEEINSYATDQLVVLISTVLPGTIRRELAPLVTNAQLVYNPYLIAMGTVAWDMVNPEMIIIGTEDGTAPNYGVYLDRKRLGRRAINKAKLLVDFYLPLMENDPRYEIGTWEEAEAIKIFYNTFISAKLSLVNMMQDVAMKLGHINVDVVTNALALSTQRIISSQYMVAGMGDGGPCHPRDNIALRYMTKELDLNYDFFDSIMYSREQQARNLAKFLVDLSVEHGLPILIHGYTYKPNVPYTDGSYSALVGYYCEQLNYHPTFVDPNTHPITCDSGAVVLLAHNIKELYCELPKDCIIVDPWRTFPKDGTYKVIYYGDTR